MNFQKNHDFPKKFKNSIKKCEKNEKNKKNFPRPSGSLAALAGRTSFPDAISEGFLSSCFCRSNW